MQLRVQKTKLFDLNPSLMRKFWKCFFLTKRFFRDNKKPRLLFHTAVFRSWQLLPPVIVNEWTWDRKLR